MVQTWNKFCFTGGVAEVSAKFPLGNGFWPAIWLFGNLGRAVYEESNTGLWPWSFDTCDEEWDMFPIPKPGKPQKISACNPNPGPGLHPYQGRGATEIDLAEVGNTDWGNGGFVFASLQVSPSIPEFYRPPMMTVPAGWTIDKETKLLSYEVPDGDRANSWYRNLSLGGQPATVPDPAVPPVGPNFHWWGQPFADAVSAGVWPLNDLAERYRTFRVEWKDGDKGYIRWYLEGVFVFEIKAESLGRYSVCTEGPANTGPHCVYTPKRLMPSEPMSVVMNSALGQWGGGAASTEGKLPGQMYVDWVRVYQRPDRYNIGCDPPDFPTKEYIKANQDLYGEAVKPEGDETCPGIYPKPTWPSRSAARKPKNSGAKLSLGLGAAVLVIVALGILGRKAYAKMVGRREPSQYASVDGSINVPILQQEQAPRS